MAEITGLCRESFCPLIDFDPIGRGIPFGCGDYLARRNQQLQFCCVALRQGRRHGEPVERVPIGCLRFRKSITRLGDLAGLPPCRERALGIARRAPVASDQFGLGFGERRELDVNLLRRGAVQVLPAHP